ncbi:MAG: RAMP superfamily protein [Limnothrix sp. BL-A-16]
MMPAIPDSYEEVPRMFRAQIDGRSKLQYAGKTKDGQPRDIDKWVNEWIDKAEQIPARDAKDEQTPVYSAKSYQISWRFVTNGGQDDGIIRPVLGKAGIPFYPGSSMKGAFRSACEQAEALGMVLVGSTDRYCGKETDLCPGILRFLGAYPTNDWTKGLIDLVHPQQEWQVKTMKTDKKPSGETAYSMVSLYQPKLRFAISSNQPLLNAEWQTIWTIWERALSVGLGSKTATGYGQSVKATSVKVRKVLYSAKLKGQGQAPKLLDGSAEFRPNIFRAALRGHALRLFGGLTDCKIAERLVEDLFGGIQSNKPTVGLLGFQFHPLPPNVEPFPSGQYVVEGNLVWLLNRSLDDSHHEKTLAKLIKKLMQFALFLGGFGKSWRRVDHQKFWNVYYQNSRGYKPLIGCHWEWSDEKSRRLNRSVSSIKSICSFLDSVRSTASEWMELKREWLEQQEKLTIQSDRWAKNWRESWHPSKVEVWARLAEGMSDSRAVSWFHKPYQRAILKTEQEKSIYKTSLTGLVESDKSTIGRVIHRMYPKICLIDNPNQPGEKMAIQTDQFFEILTIFLDDSNECREFLDFLKSSSTDPAEFQLVWGRN